MQAKEPRNYSSTRAATVLGIRAPSLSTALYRNGHYCGIRPARLPNGRLLWPADQIDQLASGARADESPDFAERLSKGKEARICRGEVA
jgi:hypothetical protein